jgi:MFS family permease
VLIWTVATAATGFAHNYVELLICRMVVGVGEAALSPAAYSLIADVFPRAKLSRPTTLYFLGGSLGPGLALVVGGLTLDWAESMNAAHRLGLLDNEPWRFVMLAVAGPGLVAAAAVVTFIRDPRTARPAVQHIRSTETLLDELRAKPLLYLGLLGGTAAISTYFNGLAAWWPTYALRNFGWPLHQSGVYFGFVLAIGALTGILSSGSIGTALMRRFGDRGNGIALFGLSIAGVIPLIGVPLIGSPDLQLGCLGVTIAFVFAINSLAPVGCQLAAGPTMRGRVTALYLASATIIGAGFGPATVAWIAGLRIVAAPIGLGDAFAVAGLGCSVIMIPAFGLVVRQMRRDQIPQWKAR